MQSERQDNRGLFAALMGDGRPLLMLTGLCLVLSGGFALFLSATGYFLPHDTQFLAMTAEQLCKINACRIVLFMFHDRVAFGGVLIAMGFLYLWMAEFPLRHQEAWAWWLFLVTGVVGFGSFLAYLGYGYLDTWHGIATLGLLICFITGMVRTFTTLPKPVSITILFTTSYTVPWTSAFGLGRACFLLTAAGMIGGGLTILLIGMTRVFVPQDLQFMGVTPADLHAINPRLIPLIAHDRAGFGGGILTCGLAMWFCVQCGTPSRSLWQVLSVAGGVGFVTAIGVHPVVGYDDLVHLAPALLGAGVFLVGVWLCYRPMCAGAQRL